MNDEIGSVVPRDGIICVYNRQGHPLCTIVGERSQPNQGLVGYTSGSFSVRRGTLVYIYDSKGQQISTVNA
jgi:hypothetical protein